MSLRCGLGSDLRRGLKQLLRHRVEFRRRTFIRKEEDWSSCSAPTLSGVVTDVRISSREMEKRFAVQIAPTDRNERPWVERGGEAR